LTERPNYINMKDYYKDGKPIGLLGALKIGLDKRLSLLLVLLFMSQLAMSQDRTVNGTVTDASTRETLPGTSIMIKGTAKGTTTNLEGFYKLSVKSGDVLVFSFIGYEKKEITVSNQSVIDAQLGLDISQLSEVIVVGYGTQEEKDVTGVVSTVSEKDFNQGQIASPERLIAGKIPGVNVTPGNTRSGGASITIRGVGSLTAGTAPLIVIDGVPLDQSGSSGTRNATNFINPSDIASVTVLKDASATAIYGNRASGGVILYTTKTGKEGNTSVTYDGSFTYSKILREPAYLSTRNFRSAVELKAPQRLGSLGESDTDWFGAVTSSTISQNHNLSFMGASEKLNYRASINRMNNQEVINGDENTVTRLSLLLSGKFLNDNLKVTFNTKNAFNQDTYKANVAGTAAAFDPTKPIRVEGNEAFGGYYEWLNQGLAPTNPVSTLEQPINLGENRRSFNALTLNYSIPFVEGLSITSTTSMDTRNGKNNYFEPYSYRNVGNDGIISNSSTSAYTYNHFDYINYKKDTKIGEFDLTAGYEFNEVYQETYGYSGANLRDDLTQFYDPRQIPQEEIALTGFSPLKEQLQSFFGRVNYSLADKYVVTASYRADGSSKFGPGNRYGYFGSAAFAWRIIEEDFFQGLTDIFSNLKLRVGYGEVANQFIPAYLWSSNYFVGTPTASYQFGDEYVQVIRPTAVDPNIQWEVLKSTNIGLDFGFFRGRLNGTLDFYVKNTSALLFSAPVAAGTNVGDRVTTNIGSMTNAGVEFALNAVVYDTDKFNWDLNFNFTYNKNEITKLNNEQDANSFGIPTGGISGDIGQNIQILRVGQPFGTFLSYNQLYNADGTPKKGSQSVTYQDINDDGVVNESDLVVQGQSIAPMILGLTSNMSYGDFDLSFTLRSKLGGNTYNNLASANGYYNRLTEGNILNNIHESALESGFDQRHLLSNYYIENSNFLKVDNLTVGYNFNKLDEIKLRIYTTVQNMIPITGYSGLDPEVGIDNNIFPPSTAFVFGVSAKF
jgi:TonB-linked SusC/RagA family outer membrane protein